ncbi:MAG: 6-phosphofructokinase, partial [Chloroflexi bacterium]|nr:6-phosphofructokinase [Chloroflexota bacterium]
YLCSMVRRDLGLRARYDRPNALHKVSSAHVSLVDRAEAEMVGAAAVGAALAGQSEQMVTLVREPGPAYRCTTGLAPLTAIAGHERVLPAAFFDGDDISDAFRAYALPLLGGALPRYPRLFA